MFNTNILDNSPGWLIFFLALALMIAGNVYGYRFGLWHRKKSPEAGDSSNGEVMGAIFGVLGFTLAFLFGMSLTRLEHKKEIVLEESGAVMNAYINARALPDSFRQEAGRLIKNYALLRYELVKHAQQKRDMKKLQAGIIMCEHIQDSLLRLGDTAATIPNADVSGFSGSVSGLIEIHMQRMQLAQGDRIPIALKVLMYIMALLGLAAMGYSSGLKGGRSLIANILLVLVFATIIGIILDMDHPTNSLFQVSQQPMLDAWKRMGRMVN